MGVASRVHAPNWHMLYCACTAQDSWALHWRKCILILNACDFFDKLNNGQSTNIKLGDGQYSQPQFISTFELTS